MPDELDAVDAQIRDEVGFENDPHGRLIARIVRHLRALTSAVRDLKARVDRLDPP